MPQLVCLWQTKKEFWPIQFLATTPLNLQNWRAGIRTLAFGFKVRRPTAAAIATRSVAGGPLDDPPKINLSNRATINFS